MSGTGRSSVTTSCAPKRSLPAPGLTWAELNAEYVTDVRWWTLEELETFAGQFAPRRLPLLVRRLIQEGPPSEPIDVGV